MYLRTAANSAIIIQTAAITDANPRTNPINNHIRDPREPIQPPVYASPLTYKLTQTQKSINLNIDVVVKL